MAHELKHGYDTFKKRTYNLSKHIDYTIFSNADFGRITPLTEFLFYSYYIHNIENLVRPTEMAASIELNKTKPNEFYKFFVESEIFQTLKKIKELTFEGLRYELMNYGSEIDELLVILNEHYDNIEEKSLSLAMLKCLVYTYPNDSQLGEEIRKIFNQIKS
jgi:hypothetical protein